MKLIAFTGRDDLQLHRGVIIESLNRLKVLPIPGNFNNLAEEQLASIKASFSSISQSNLINLQDVNLHNPVPNAGKIICVGLNYLDHVEETNLPMPDHPVLFAKWQNTLSGPNDTIILDGTSKKVDYEAELAFVIGKTACNVAEEAAMDYVAGYLCANDVSARDLQFADSQWVRGKSLNGFCPLGPYLVTRDEVPDPHNLRIQCRVNNQLVQDSNTSQLIFKIPALVAWISAGITLQPGDVVLTGTPAGVGFSRNPPAFFQPGDVCEVEIEGLGTLRNTFADLVS